MWPKTPCNELLARLVGEGQAQKNWYDESMWQLWRASKRQKGLSSAAAKNAANSTHIK